jgi:hypothetical protein
MKKLQAVTTFKFFMQTRHRQFLATLSLGLAAFVFCAGAAVASTATYYVGKTNCSDSGSGTLAQPFCTPQKGADVARAGDTVYIRAGTYTDAVILRYSGTSGSPITFRNYPNETPVFDFGVTSLSSPIKRIELGVSGNTAVGWFVIEGLELKNGWDGIKIYNVHDTIIRNNNIHDSFNQGILGSGLRVTITRNRIWRTGLKDLSNTTNDNKLHGMYLVGSDYVITNNVIYDTRAYGITIAGYPYEASKYPNPEYAGADNAFISNNTIAFGRFRPAIVLWQPLATNAKIFNNIYYQNAPGNSQGIDFVGDGGGHTITNNLLDPPASSFAGVSAFDFHLLSSSPAINAGITLADVPADFAGISRPQPEGGAYDIGAYEYVSSPPVRGDLNGDTQVTLADLRLLLRMLLGQATPSTDAKALAAPTDQLTLADARALVQLLVS